MAVWTHIAHDSLSLPAASVTWGVATPISGSYDHLCIKISGRSAYSGYFDSIQVNFNNDTTAANYSTTQLLANTATPISQRGAWTAMGYVTADSALADTFGNTTVWIPNYANTANFKQCVIQNAGENASTTDDQWILNFSALLWEDTSAMTEIDIYLGTAGDDWMANSTFDLYGITGA